MMYDTFNWGIVVQLVSIVATGVGTWAAIRSDIAVLHANQINTKEQIKELQVDVKRHERFLAGCDRRHHEATGKFTVSEG
jgi:hypothetical protein